MRADQPSSTAILIARSIMLSARDGARGRLVAPGEAEALGAILAGSRAAWFDFVSRHDWTRRLIFAAEQQLLAGASTHYLARKRWLEQQARAALARGITQVVVLGAGFDTLAWRLHQEGSPVACFELDHPATQAPKAAALAPGASLTFLAADLAVDSPAKILRACRAFRADRPAIFIAEGLLMYFPATRVAALLQELATLTPPSSELLLSFMEQAPNGSISFRGEHAAIAWWLRWRSEPFRWGLTRTALPEFLRSQGWQAGVVVDHDSLRALVLAPLGLAQLPLARGECLCHCTLTAS